MMAAFESTCPACQTVILAGESIEQGSVSGRWLHEGCQRQAEARIAREAACPDCFIVKPCECDT